MEYQCTRRSYSIIFRIPRNSGDLAGCRRDAEIENPVCGDVIRLSLKMRTRSSGGHSLQSQRLRSSDCVWLSFDRTRARQDCEEVRALKRDDLIAAVGGLPPASAHAAQLAFDALWNALAQIRSSKPQTPQGS